MEQLITEVVLRNKAMIKRTTSLVSFALMQLVFIVVFAFVFNDDRNETTLALLVILILSILMMVVRIIAREPWKIVFTADRIDLYYLFVKKSVSSYDLSAINLGVIKSGFSKQQLINKHLYKAPYLAISLHLGAQQLHLLPMYLGAKDNKNVPENQKLLEQFLDRILMGKVLPEVPVNR